jgi:general secretion pathway protein I
LPSDSECLFEQGFTLLEVLVALAIAGLGLAALFAAASGGLNSVDLAARYLTATRHAEAHLAEIGISMPLVAGEQDGLDSNGFRWRLTIRSIATRQADRDRGIPGRVLYAVEIAESWPAGLRQRSIRIETLRLGSTPVEGR